MTNTDDDISQFRLGAGPNNVVSELSVQGYTAVEVLQPDLEACVLAVDLTDGQTLVVSSRPANSPSVEDTCRRVSQFATAVLPNLP